MAGTFQGVSLLFYPQNIWVIPFSSPEGEKVALCLFIEEARGLVRPPRCWPESWVEQIFVYTVWGTTVVLLIPALAGVPAAPGRWQPSGAGREHGRHCCVSQPRSMPLCLLFHMFTPPWEPGHEDPPVRSA